MNLILLNHLPLLDGNCYCLNPSFDLLNAIADGSITMLFSSVALMLIYLAVKQKDVSFKQLLQEQFVRLPRVDRNVDDLNYRLETRVKQRTWKLNYLNQQLRKEINKRKQIEANLQAQLRLKQLIISLSTKFTNFPGANTEGILQEGLKIISEFAGVDIAYLFPFFSSNPQIPYLYQWSNLQEKLDIVSWDRLYLKQNLPWAVNQIKHQQIINLVNLDNLPFEASKDQNFLRQQNIKSLLMLPVFYGGLLVGLIGFSSVTDERNWTEGDIQLLRLTGEIFINASERCHQQQQLIWRAQELENSNRELQQFNYIVSHDLQEPLRSIRSYAELLQDEYQGKLEIEAHEYIDFIVSGTQRMQKLIQDLLFFSRMGRQPQKFSSVSCEEVLKEVVANLQIAIAENQAIVTWNSLPRVIADKSQLTQLWQNLIANSIKFRSKESPQIHISATIKEQKFIFSLRDNGIGIDPKHAERIFVIFQRLHTSRTYPGTGIGLAICKRIIELHQGKIWVESSLAEGATFYFSLPIRTQ